MQLKEIMNIANPVMVKVSELKNHPHNPRKQVKEAMDFLEKSIDELGTFRTLLVNKKNQVLGGNQLLSVLKKKGITEVLCVYPKEELTTKQEKAIIIADNQNSFHKSSNQFDIDLMSNEYDDIMKNFDLGLEEIDLSSLYADKEPEVDNKNQEIDIDKIDTSECKIIFKFDAMMYETILAQINRLKQSQNFNTNELLLIDLLAKYESQISV